MAKSYPSKLNNSGLWNMSDVTTAVSNNDWCSGHRGIWSGGNVDPGAVTNIMDYVSIVSLGNAADFGDLTVARKVLGAVASFTRACFGGGRAGSISNVIDYITVASTGDAADFGNLSVTRGYVEGMGNSSVRGIYAAGSAPPSYLNTIDYITIASVGDAADFGDLTTACTNHEAFSSPTRGVAGGGFDGPGDAYQNVIDYTEITSTGNAIDFGDLSSVRAFMETASSHTRGLFCTGGPTRVNTIEYVTIPTKGNAINFGDASSVRNYGAGSSNGKRAVVGGGGMAAPAAGGDYQVTLDYIAIAHTGNTADFGDLSTGRHALSATSNGHGGLGL